MTGEQKVHEYLEVLSSKAPIPGGGGASALGGALGAALGRMVGNLTTGKKRYADVEEEIQEYLAELAILQKDMMSLADEDAAVFAPLAAAYGMPTETAAQQAEKDRVMEANLLSASVVPMQIMKKALAVIDVLEELEQKGSRMALSDVGVAVQFARTSMTGAVMNIYINTKSMKNREKAAELNESANAMLKEGVERADIVYDKVLEALTQ